MCLHIVHVKRAFMKTDPKVGKEELIAAVKAVREKLGDSQQVFAGKLGVAIRSVAHYETDREPRGKSLAGLAQLAKQAGLNKEEELFLRAVQQELGAMIVTGLLDHLVPRGDAEHLWVDGLLTVLRTEKYQHLRPQLAELLRPAIQDSLDALKRRSDQDLKQLIRGEGTPGEFSDHMARRDEVSQLYALLKGLSPRVTELRIKKEGEERHKRSPEASQNIQRYIEKNRES
jgi:transcriptional regulator with XRE-family HTH domain